MGHSWRGIWWQRRDAAASVEGENLAGIGMENEVEVSSGRWRSSGKAGIKKKIIEGSKSVPGSVDALASIPCGWVS